MMADKAWIGVDLDGTLAHYDGFKGPGEIGPPIPKMVERVKRWKNDGKRVKIMTARDAGNSKAARIARKAIKRRCIEHLGFPLEITCVKDHDMVALWDDRAVQVRKNTGERVG